MSGPKRELVEELSKSLNETVSVSGKYFYRDFLLERISNQLSVIIKSGIDVYAIQEGDCHVREN